MGQFGFSLDWQLHLGGTGVSDSVTKSFPLWREISPPITFIWKYTEWTLCYLHINSDNYFRYLFLATMAMMELDSFVVKFKQLCANWLSASLNIETLDGSTTVCLKADLGKAVEANSSVGKQRSPSYFWRKFQRQENKSRMELMLNKKLWKLLVSKVN